MYKLFYLLLVVTVSCSTQKVEEDSHIDFDDTFSTSILDWNKILVEGGIFEVDSQDYLLFGSRIGYGVGKYTLFKISESGKFDFVKLSHTNQSKADLFVEHPLTGKSLGFTVIRHIHQNDVNLWPQFENADFEQLNFVSDLQRENQVDLCETTQYFIQTRKNSNLRSFSLATEKENLIKEYFDSVYKIVEQHYAKSIIFKSLHLSV